MGAARYALGTLELAAFLLGVVSAGRALRQWLVPGWRGPHAVLASAVLALTTACVTLQLLGAAGLLREVPVVVAGLLLAAATGRQGLRAGPITGFPWPRAVPWRLAATVALLAALAAVWAVEVRGVVLHGVLDVDSLTYHLPFAQEWAQTHRVGPLVHVAPGTPVQYYPGNDELLRASGILAYGRDLLGPYLNVAWLALLVLAATALGLRRHRVLGTVATVVVLAGGPLVAKFLPGGAMSDIASLAAVLAMAALLLEAFDTDSRGGLVVAGAAAGLAVGTKLTVLPLLGVLTLALLLVKELRWRGWLGFAAGLCVPALFWYVRDLVLTSSPVPFLAVPGLPSPSYSLFDTYDQSVLHYATDSRVVKDVYVTQAYQVLGPAWWLLVVLAVVGVLLGLRAAQPVFKVLGGSSLVGGLVYLATPTTAGGPEGRPLLFAVDLRYALPFLVLAVCLVPLTLTGRKALAAEVVLSLGAVATLLAPWRLTADNDQQLTTTVAAGLLGAVAVLVALHSGRVLPVLSRPAAGGLAVLAAAALYPLVDLAEDRAYADDRSPASYRQLRATEGLAVAVTGNLRISPYTGRTLGNRVHYLAVVTSDGGFEDFRDCRAWRAAVVREHPDVVVVDRFARGWVDDPAFVAVVPDNPPEPRVVRLVGTPTDATCKST